MRCCIFFGFCFVGPLGRGHSQSTRREQLREAKEHRLQRMGFQRTTSSITTLPVDVQKRNVLGLSLLSSSPSFCLHTLGCLSHLPPGRFISVPFSSKSSGNESSLDLFGKQLPALWPQLALSLLPLWLLLSYTNPSSPPRHWVKTPYGCLF
jgi:hypothetical protein